MSSFSRVPFAEWLKNPFRKLRLRCSSGPSGPSFCASQPRSIAVLRMNGNFLGRSRRAVQVNYFRRVLAGYGFTGVLGWMEVDKPGCRRVEPPDPMPVRLLRARRVMEESHHLMHLLLKLELGVGREQTAPWPPSACREIPRRYSPLFRRNFLLDNHPRPRYTILMNKKTAKLRLT